MSNDQIIINKFLVKFPKEYLKLDWTLENIYKTVYSINGIDENNKKIPLNLICKIYKHKNYAVSEFNTLKKLHNIPNIPKIVGSNFSKNNCYTIMTKCKGMDLFDYIQIHGNCNEKMSKSIIKSILENLIYIHKLGIIHCDIKPENIMYDNETEEISIIDFEGRSTDKFRSPEQILGDNITNKTDIWSLGVTLYVIIEGEFPFDTPTDIVYKNDITYNLINSETLKNFINCILSKQSSNRPSAEDLLNHEWLNT